MVEKECNKARMDDFRVNPELEPIYLLSQDEYRAVVNGLTNVLIDVIIGMKNSGDAGGARAVALASNAVLIDYDDDVAEHILRSCDDSSESRISPGQDQLF
jgi:hypothetical protein